MFKINKSGDNLIFNVWVQPKASRSEITGLYGEALKIKVMSPPVEGKANQECLRFLASFFDIKVSQIKLVSGENSRSKRIAVCGVLYDEAMSKLEKYI